MSALWEAGAGSKTPNMSYIGVSMNAPSNDFTAGIRMPLRPLISQAGVSMADPRYAVADRVQYLGPVKAGFPLPGRIGTVVEITDEGHAVVRFGMERITVRADDARFKKVDFD